VQAVLTGWIIAEVAAAVGTGDLQMCQLLCTMFSMQNRRRHRTFTAGFSSSPLRVMVLPLLWISASCGTTCGTTDA